MKKLFSFLLLGALSISLTGSAQSFQDTETRYRSQIIQMALVIQDIASSGFNEIKKEFLEAQTELQTLKKEEQTVQARLDRTANKTKRKQIQKDIKKVRSQIKTANREVQVLKKKVRIAQRNAQSSSGVGANQVQRPPNTTVQTNTQTSTGNSSSTRCTDARAINFTRPLPCRYPANAPEGAGSPRTPDGSSNPDGMSENEQQAQADQERLDELEEGEGNDTLTPEEHDELSSLRSNLPGKRDGVIEACVSLVNHGTDEPYGGVPFHDGTLTVNGNEYPYRSGGFGRGDTPQGENISYRVVKHQNSRSETGYTIDGVGFSFLVEGWEHKGCDLVDDPRYPDEPREYIRIHPDGGKCGTKGCFGLQGNGSDMERFRDDLNAEIDANGGYVTLVFDCGDEDDEEEEDYEYCEEDYFDPYGCTDPKALNYDPQAVVDDGSCYYKEGCTDEEADNYDSSAQVDDGMCYYSGCTDEKANNYNAYANYDDGTCRYDSNGNQVPYGCTEEGAKNYNPNAKEEDGSCVYEGDNADGTMDPIPDSMEYGCMDPSYENYNPNAVYDDASCDGWIDFSVY